MHNIILAKKAQKKWVILKNTKSRGHIHGFNFLRKLVLFTPR